MTTPFPPFPEFFAAVMGHEPKDWPPHDWQSELARRFQDDDVPARIEVPTGLGKTSTVLIAIYHLAWQLHHGHDRTAPQRIFHIVNRRTLVDDTHGFIGQIAQAINEGEEHAVIGPARAALCRLLGPGDDVPVAVGSIHGETPHDTPWLRATGCSIVTLTPHQYVSRLLMRAFAVSPSRRPIDAGLVGVDRLVLFDEPHLAIPAVQTIFDAQRLQSRATIPLGLPLGQTILMGATLRGLTIDGLDNRRVLRLNPDDPAIRGSRAAQLLHAPKRLHLERAKSSSDADIAKTLAARAMAVAADGRSVVVFTNTVGLAQRVYRALKEQPRWAEQTQLITSRFRPVDRKQGTDVSGITVTTQCLEVGVDLSFDGLVTEATSWSALVQRLGRLNRRGDLTAAEGYLVVAANGSVRAGTAAVYGEEVVRAAVELLARLEHEEPDGIDASPAALSRVREHYEDDRLDGERPRAATLHAGLVPLMTHTRPSPSPDLPVDAFVNGPDRPVNREIEVAWREHVDGLTDTKIGAVLANEVVTIQRSALAHLLRGELASDKEPISDLPDIAADAALQAGRAVVDLRQVLMWSGSSERALQPESVGHALAAERIVLPQSAGGYDPELGWTGDPGHVDDVHLAAALETLQRNHDRGHPTRLTMCLSASLFSAACDRRKLTGERRHAVEELLLSLTEADEGSLGLVVDQLTTALPAPLQAFLHGVVPEGASVKVQVDRVLGHEVVSAHRAVVCTVTVAPRHTGKRSDVISLDAHQEQVGAWAEADGVAAGLRNDLAADIGVAGRHHDIGKAYPPFQRYLSGAPTARVSYSRVTLPDGKALPLLAKPLDDVDDDSESSRETDRIARAAAGLPRRFRHEAKSVEICREHRVGSLALHLIGSHHGFYRPVVPVLRGTHLEGYSHADEFAGLNDDFGPWGLAYLEAVLRLADWRASANPIPTPQHVECPTEELLSASAADWNAPRYSPATSGAAEHALPGLITHPLTGWLASVGLLASAVDLGDSNPALWWDTSGSTPQTPILRTDLPLRDLVAHALDRSRWAEADEVLRKALGADGPALRRKHQKLKPADRLRNVLTLMGHGTETSRLLGLLGDAAPADSGGQVELPIVPFANNSSYPSVALAFLERNNAAEECLDALLDVNLGYSKTACDGGFDRPRGAIPLVNGLGAPGDERMVRTALAPLALYAMARLGNTGASALGVTRAGRQLRLVLPISTTPVSFEMLRSMIIGARAPRSWAWSEIGAEWVYSASREYLSDRKDIDIVWSGRIIPRAELKEIQRHGINRP